MTLATLLACLTISKHILRRNRKSFTHIACILLNIYKAFSNHRCTTMAVTFTYVSATATRLSRSVEAAGNVSAMLLMGTGS